MSDNFEHENFISAMDLFLSYLFEFMYVLFFIIYITNKLYLQYEYSQKYKDQFWEVYVDIDEAYTRKSMIREQSSDSSTNDDDTGHWIFWSGKSCDPQFQATNCVICGEYEISNTINAPKCKCVDFELDLSEIYSSDHSSVDEFPLVILDNESEFCGASSGRLAKLAGEQETKRRKIM